jgi:ubiquinone/menaquinone biosynthesis C-methylase UbiE
MQIANKSMDRNDLVSGKAEYLIDQLNRLITRLSSNNLSASSWIGSLPNGDVESEMNALSLGLEQRLNYEPLPHAADDLRFPWFLYWEIFWVLAICRPYLQTGMKLLDAGGVSSLFSCYLASKGYEVHAIDLKDSLRMNGEKISKKMGWNMYSYRMNLEKLEFPDSFFDHVFSICVFEHLDYDVKIAALEELARCIKPGGILGITFDYRNPAPGVVGYGKDTRFRNQIKTPADIGRQFCSNSNFKLLGNKDFYDNEKSYLLHKRFGNTPYTFGAIFLQRQNLS